MPQRTNSADGLSYSDRQGAASESPLTRSLSNARASSISVTTQHARECTLRACSLITEPINTSDARGMKIGSAEHGQGSCNYIFLSICGGTCAVEC